MKWNNINLCKTTAILLLQVYYLMFYITANVLHYLIIAAVKCMYITCMKKLSFMKIKYTNTYILVFGHLLCFIVWYALSSM